jgi:isopenicillin-N N-acyltransferase-like protein
MSNSLPTIEVSGSPSELGRAHGEALRSEIREILTAFFHDNEQSSERHGVPSFTKARALEISGAYRDPLRDREPDLYTEMEGIADGADVRFSEILALNAFLDLYDYISHGFADRGCTTLLIPGASDGSGAVIGQNYDMDDFYAPAAVVLHIKPDEGPESIVYTSAGMLGCAGMNSDGIGVVINNLHASDSGPGLPYTAIVRRILATRSIGPAISAVLDAPRASGMNYVIGDPNGEIYGLETTARRYDIFVPFDGPMAHANHYLAERLKGQDRRPLDQMGQSILRWGRATRLLKAHPSPDASALRVILEDRVNTPIGICRTPVDLDGEPCGQTIAGIVLEPPEHRASFTKGPTGENEWQTFTLG